MSDSVAYPIPDRLNTALVLSVQAGALGLLWASARLSGVAAVGLAVAFSFLLLTNYALLHEAAHDHLHSEPRTNRILGACAGLLFPASTSLVRVTHGIHHCYNRTDEEIFDQYKDGDNMLLKTVQWYTPLLGFFWCLVVAGSILFGLCPSLMQSRLARRSTTTKFMSEFCETATVRRIRLELMAGCLYWLTVWRLLSLDWHTLALCYGCFAFNWSTRQYVSHAYTPRHVVHGAFNLKVGRVMSRVLLNSQWDLVHHQKPWLPWTALPEEGKHSAPPVSYLGQYLKMWRVGMVRATEPSPTPLPSELTLPVEPVQG